MMGDTNASKSSRFCVNVAVQVIQYQLGVGLTVVQRQAIFILHFFVKSHFLARDFRREKVQAQNFVQTRLYSDSMNRVLSERKAGNDRHRRPPSPSARHIRVPV